MSTEQKNSATNGVINAISAYVIWGFAPLYFKLLASVDSTEILMHRVIWSCLILLLIVVFSRKWRLMVSIFKQPILIGKLLITSTVLAINWFLFIWAINHDHLLDASLGYYINPLFSVALGMIFLSEKLRSWQWFAVFLAVVGVLIQLISLGTLPIISLALAGSFGTYGLLRKKLVLDSFVGLLVESLIMLPIAICYWFFFVHSHASNMFENTTQLNITLMMAGVMTTVPLLCFTNAAKNLKLSTLGFFQYIGPSLMFVLAVFAYDEPLQVSKLVTFLFIWVALMVYSIDSYRARKAIVQS